jgi:hypothetical protein
MRDLRRELGALLMPFASVPPPSGPIGSTSSRPPPSPSSPPQVSSPAPPQVSSAPPPRTPSTDPEWLERGAARHRSAMEQTSSEIGRLAAMELTSRPAAWLSAFAAAQRPERFESLASRLAGALPWLFADFSVRVLFAVRCTLDELAADTKRRPLAQMARARQLQMAFSDAAFLARLAEAVLSEERPPREMTELVLRLSTAIAYPLYSARLKLYDVAAVRRRFVLLIRELGTDALPMIRAGLLRLVNRRDVPVAADLASDLFLASPRVRDDEAGDATLPYLQGSAPDLTALALEALVGFWGPRAIPTLLELLDSPDAHVGLAAINGLRALAAVDELAAWKIAAIVRLSPPGEVRAAGRAALLEAQGDAHVVARRLLADLS